MKDGSHVAIGGYNVVYVFHNKWWLFFNNIGVIMGFLFPVLIQVYDIHSPYNITIISLLASIVFWLSAVFVYIWNISKVSKKKSIIFNTSGGSLFSYGMGMILGAFGVLLFEKDVNNGVLEAMVGLAIIVSLLSFIFREWLLWEYLENRLIKRATIIIALFNLLAIIFLLKMDGFPSLLQK